MYVKCWQCSEEIDTISVEHQIYRRIINDLRGMLCENSTNDDCDMWWKHEDCRVISMLIQEFGSRI